MSSEEKEPAFTVASFAVIMNARFSTFPIPVIHSGRRCAPPFLVHFIGGKNRQFEKV